MILIYCKYEFFYCCFLQDILPPGKPEESANAKKVLSEKLVDLRFGEPRYAGVHHDLGVPRDGIEDYGSDEIPFLEAWVYDCTFGLLSTYIGPKMIKDQPLVHPTFDLSKMVFEYFSLFRP